MTPQRPHLSPATTGGSQLTPSRRRHVGQPPTLLTTALSAAHSQIAGVSAGSGCQPPQSATSLSAPFSPYQYSPYSPSPNAETRDSSPMATRAQTGFNAPYNPQQWGPVANSTSASLDVATGTRQSSHAAARFPRFAPRPLGPDGMSFEHPVWQMLSNLHHRRACCLSSSPLLTKTRRLSD